MKWRIKHESRYIDGSFDPGSGSQVHSGRALHGSYTNKEDQRVYTTDIIADDQEFADSKNLLDGGKQAQEMGKPIGDGFMPIPNGVGDEGLPFN